MDLMDRFSLDVNPLVAVTLLFMIAVVSANTGTDLKMPWMILLGDASYACYLLHTILIYGLRTNEIEVDGTLPSAIGLIVASWACAILWHLSVERLTRMLRNTLSRESL